MHIRLVTNAGDVIRKARQAKGMTQTQLANLVDASQPTVAKWEAGQDLTASRLGAVLDALDLSWSDLDEVAS